MKNCRGALIVFEGCDRVGKSTQCKKLVQALHERNIKAEYMSFPDRTSPVGQLINDYLTKNIDLTDKAIHLLFSANRWELEPKMKSYINNGVTLVVDRYVYSGIAFSAAKEGMSIGWCKQPEAGLPKPDAVFFLTLSPEALSKRGGFGTERYEVAEIQKNVRNNFLELEDDLWQGLDGLCAVITEINHAYLPLCVPNSLELESLKTGLGEHWKFRGKHYRIKIRYWLLCPGVYQYDLLQNVFHIFGTQPDLELLEFLGAIFQERLVQLDHVVVSVEGTDHELALSEEVQE